MTISNRGAIANARIAGINDCETAVYEGADPKALAASSYGADEALINALGRTWVLRAAGAPDDSDESWQEYGLPWCQAYANAYRARAEELAKEKGDFPCDDC